MGRLILNHHTVRLPEAAMNLDRNHLGIELSEEIYQDAKECFNLIPLFGEVAEETYGN